MDNWWEYLLIEFNNITPNDEGMHAWQEGRRHMYRTNSHKLTPREEEEEEEYQIE